MGENTAISWADNTFNPWEGCTRVSPACDHCYAADRAHRFGNDRLWAGELRRTSPANWRKPLKWNAAAAAAGVRVRVFCASLADVFDNQAPREWRADLFELIRATPNLIWMLLTKRPQNAVRLIPRGFFVPQACLPNVELGTTVEDQARADQRLAPLAVAGVATGWRTFVSAEPLLGPVDLTRVVVPGAQPGRFNALTGTVAEIALLDMDGLIVGGRTDYPPLRLVIAGGESGPQARPSNPQWFRDLRDQCAAANVPFHFKQNGEWVSVSEVEGFAGNLIHTFEDGRSVRRVGTARAGRTLDGREHLAMPEAA